MSLTLYGKEKVYDSIPIGGSSQRFPRSDPVYATPVPPSCCKRAVGPRGVQPRMPGQAVRVTLGQHDQHGGARARALATAMGSLGADVAELLAATGGPVQDLRSGRAASRRAR
jgi:hypothetical protein